VTPLETLRKGAEILGPLLSAHGFTYYEDRAGHGSGGEYASGKYIKEDRVLEIHFRHSLGLVTYQIGSESIRHEVFMRALLALQVIRSTDSAICGTTWKISPRTF